MSNQSSRELALERRKALSETGKKSTSMGASSDSRIRTSADARSTRTNASFVKTTNNSAKTHKTFSDSYSSSAPSTSRRVKSVSNPSRELVLARREELSRRGKSADKSKDRTRIDVEKNSPKTIETTPPLVDTESIQASHKNSNSNSSGSTSSFANSTRTTKLNSRAGERRTTTKRRAIQNTSRALVLARREAQSKHGKTAGKQPTSAASVARQGDPDITSRELSQRVLNFVARVEPLVKIVLL